jgi:hypothetical protein
MSTDWAEKQRKKLAESQERVNKLKLQLPPTQGGPIPPENPPPLTIERLRKRRFGIIVALTVINCLSIFQGTYRLFTWPNSASLMVPREQITVYHDATGDAEYKVQLPLKEFPYNLQLQQQYRYDLLSVSSFNLILILAILHSYWQQSRLEQKQPGITGTGENGQRSTVPP